MFFSVFVCCSIVSLRSQLRILHDVRYDFRCSIRLYLLLFAGGLVSYLFTLFVFGYVQCCLTHIVLCCCFVCLRLVSCVTYIASLPGLSIFYCPSMFSDVSKVDGKVVQLFDIAIQSCSKEEESIFRRVSEVII